MVDKSEMMADVQEYPPFGTYTTLGDELWAKRGWMLFSSSGTTGVPKGILQSHALRSFHVEPFRASGLACASGAVVSTVTVSLSHRSGSPPSQTSMLSTQLAGGVGPVAVKVERPVSALSDRAQVSATRVVQVTDGQAASSSSAA